MWLFQINQRNTNHKPGTDQLGNTRQPWMTCGFAWDQYFQAIGHWTPSLRVSIHVQILVNRFTKRGLWIDNSHSQVLSRLPAIVFNKSCIGGLVQERRKSRALEMCHWYVFVSHFSIHRIVQDLCFVSLIIKDHNHHHSRHYRSTIHLP